jgi:arylsulfatase A-like enzyme
VTAGLLLTLGVILAAGPVVGASPVPEATSAPAPSAAPSPSAEPEASFDPTVGTASPIPSESPLAGSPLPSGSPPPSPAPSVLPPGVERPDIIVLLLDDFGQIDDRVWERLPTIRRLFLESGVRFTDMVGNDPLCCPGRANLLTGQWAEHHGVIRNDGRLFDPRVSLATELQSVGYWTGIFGKYFNQTPLLQRKWPPGWDRAFIFGGNYWNFPAWDNGRLQRFGGEPEDYSTTVVQRKVLEALATAPADQPRFLWLAPFAVHGGWDAKRTQHSLQPWPAPKDAGSPACADLPRWSTPAHFEFDVSDKPDHLWNRKLVRSWNLTRVCESLLSVDRMLATTLIALETQGRPEPLVILSADNGMAWGAHRWWAKFVPFSTPVPFFLRWPQVLGDAPATVETTVSNIDVAPTLCAIAGCRMGPFPNGHEVDGIDLLPLLLRVGEANLGAPPGAVRTLPDGVAREADGRITGLRTGREVVFTEHLTRDGVRRMRPWRGLQTTDEASIGRWVYTIYIDRTEELYDISGGPCWEWQPGEPGDPCQLLNLADDPTYADLKAILAATLRGRSREPMKIALPE